MEDNDKILKSLENISDNLEYLIDFFQTKEETKKDNYSINALETLSSDFSSFNILLKSIDSNIKTSTQKMSAYLDSLSPIEGKGWSDNPEMEQFNLNLNNLIVKLDDLKNSIGDINTNLNITIDTTQIDNIKEKLQSDFNVQLDIVNIDAVINETIEKLKIFQNIPISINIGDSLDKLNTLQTELGKIKELSNTEINFKDLEDIKINLDFGNSLENLNSIITELNTLHDFKLDKINLDFVNTENIQKIISDLSQLESISSVNLDGLKNSLIQIQELDFSNLIKELSEPLKISIDNNIINQIDTITSEFDKIKNIEVEINFNVDLTTKIDELKSELLTISETLKNSIVIEPIIDLKINGDDIDKIREEFQNIEVTFNIDNNFFDKIKTELLDNEFDIILNPVINTKDINIDKREEEQLKIIKEEKTIYNDDKMLSYMEDNNRLLKQLLSAINNKESKTDTIHITPETVNNKSIVNVTPNENVNTGMDLSELIPILNDIADNTKGMLKQQTLGKFKDNIDC